MPRPRYDQRAVMIVARILSDVVRKRRVAIAQEPLPARVGRLQHEQVVDPGLDLRLAAVAEDRRDAVAAAPPLEGVPVGPPADLDSGPRVLDDVHARACDGRPCGEEMLDEPPPERFDGVDRILLGKRIDRVAHRVGGEQAGVVPLGVRGVEVALESDVDREIAEVVSAGPARDLDETDLGLSVPGPTENDRHSSAPSIGAVAKRAEQQWDVIMLLTLADDKSH